MKRVYVSGFESSTVLELRAFLDIRVWLNSAPDCTHDVVKLTALDFPAVDVSNLPFDHACYDYVYASLSVFNDIYTRSFPYYEKTYHGLLNAFNSLFGYCYRLLVSERIEYVVFANIPHEAVDFIVEKIARYLNIPILMCHQSPFAERFWVARDLSDFGKFSKIPELSSNEHYQLKRDFDWFYMSGERHQYNFRKLISDLWKAPRSFPYVFYKYKQAFDYRKSMSVHIRTNISLERKYVYFPLHLQPELTTSALGGIYADQLLALERLAEMLPSDWVIYVKENPKQTEMQRDKVFFQRIAALSNVNIVPMQTNSMELIRSAQFVATITGTAGWEAISVGKKVLVFGLPWYRCLPGVFQFQPSLVVDDIALSPSIDPKDLEAAVTRLLCKAGCGVVDPAYSVLVPGYDRKKNARQVADVIQILVRVDG